MVRNITLRLAAERIFRSNYGPLRGFAVDGERAQRTRGWQGLVHGVELRGFEPLTP